MIPQNLFSAKVRPKPIRCNHPRKENPNWRSRRTVQPGAICRQRSAVFHGRPCKGPEIAVGTEKQPILNSVSPKSMAEIIPGASLSIFRPKNMLIIGKYVD